MSYIKSTLTDISCKVTNVVTDQYQIFTSKSSTELTLFIDDTINVFKEKINNALYSSYKTNSDCLFLWIEIDSKTIPITFSYDQDINYDKLFTDEYDIHFVDKSGNAKHVSLVYLDDLLIQSIFERYSIKGQLQIYVVHIQDWFTHKQIPVKKYTNKNWPSQLPSLDIFYHGFVKKYWPRLTMDHITTMKYPKSNKQFQTMIHETTRFLNDFFQEKQNKHTINCLKNDIQLLKINTPCSKDVTVNLIRLFSDIELSENIPFSKLVLDDYIDTYYKLYKPSIDETTINRSMIEHWIKDFKKDNIYGYNKYINFNQVLLLKLYYQTWYVSLIIHQNGNVDIIFDRTKLTLDKDKSIMYTNPEFTKDIFQKLIDTCNEFLDKIDESFVGLSNPMIIDKQCLENNNSISKVDVLNCELRYPRFQWKEPTIHNFYDNLYPFTRKIQEKYYYQLKNEDSVYLRYKRVNNYNNDETIDSVISTLSNPRLGLSKENIVDKIQTTFDLPLEQANEKYDDWWSQAQNKIADDKRYYSIFSTSEPGVETTIIQRVGSNDTIVELNGINSFLELNQIMVFLETSFWIYSEFISTKKDWNMYKLFQKKNTHKKQYDSLITSTNQENDIDLLDESPDEIYANPVVVNPINESEEVESPQEDFVDPFLIDDDDDIMEGGDVDITRYMIRRLTDSQRDPNLFNFNPLQKDKQGKKLTYTRICQSSQRRQPIVVSNQELKQIDDHDKLVGSKSYYKPPGKHSLKFGSTLDKKQEFNYICPRYWDIENNISLAPDKLYNPTLFTDKQLYDSLSSNDSIDPNTKKPFMNMYQTSKQFDSETKSKLIDILWDHIPAGMWDARKIIPANKTKGKVEQTIYDRRQTSFWRNTDPLKVDEYIVNSLGPDYREENIDMPCCFTKTTFSKKKIQVPNKFIVSYQIPSNDNSIGDLNEPFYELCKQNMDFYGKESNIVDTMRKVKELIKKKPTNYIKQIKQFINKEYYQKIEKVESEGIGLKDLKSYGFFKMGVGKQNKESLLLSFSKIFSMNVVDLKNYIKKNYTIDLYQCSNLPNVFQTESTLESLDLFKKSKHIFHNFLIPMIDTLFIDLQSINTLDALTNYFETSSQGKTYDYIYKLFLSYTNYINYVDSGEYKRDEYFIYPIETLFDVNVIVFEDIFNDMKIKTPLSNTYHDQRYICLLQKNIYYEPILFHMEYTNQSDINYLKPIQSEFTEEEYDILRRYSKLTLNPVYIFTPNDSNQESYNKEAYNYLCELFKKDGQLLSFETLFSEHYQKFETIIENYQIQNVTIQSIYIDGYHQATHLLTKDDYLIPIKPMNPPLLNLSKLSIIYDLFTVKSYHSIDEYKQFFKQIKTSKDSYKIEGLVVENKTIVNILVNGSYVPVLPELYKSSTKYPVKCYIDIRKLDRDIQLHRVLSDPYHVFDDTYTYEQTINNTFNENLVYFIKQNPSFTKTYVVETKQEVDENKDILLTWMLKGDYIVPTNKLHDIHTMGTIIDSKQVSNGYEIKVKCEPLNLIQKILRDPIRINEDKRILLYSIIYVLSKQVIVTDTVDKQQTIPSKICEQSENCEYPCVTNSSTCKLTIDDNSYDGKSLLRKFCWKFVDLLLIYKGDLQELSYYKIEPYELEKTKKRFEYFFTYRDYIDHHILDYLFQIKSDYIHPYYM